MRAAVLERFSEPLVLREVPVPEPGPGEALVRVRAAGLCGTDLKITSGAFADIVVPRIPGHEVAGDVVAASSGTGPEPGRRVACYMYESCGSCESCRAGTITTCPEKVRLGFDRDGGLAEFVAVAERNLLPVPDPVSYEQAAVAMDAVATSWMALHHRARIEPGERLAIVGAGGLGIHAVQIARAAGCRVAVVDPLESRRELALELGAEIAVAPGDAERRIREWSGEGVAVALEISGARDGFDVAAACLGRRGRIVCCGYYPGVEYGIESYRLVSWELRIIGSIAASLGAAREGLEAIAEGIVEPQIASRGDLDGVNDSLDRLREGRHPGRIVIEL